MEIKVLEMTDGAKAIELAAKVKSVTSILDMPEIDEAPVEVDSKFYVRFITEMDISEYVPFYVNILDKKPDEEVFEVVNNNNTQMNEEGFALYTKIMSDVQIHGGLDPSVDASILVYNSHVVAIRNMLKDGLVVWTYRKFALELYTLFPVEQSDKYLLWIKELAQKWETPAMPLPDSLFDALRTAPVGAI